MRRLCYVGLSSVSCLALASTAAAQSIPAASSPAPDAAREVAGPATPSDGGVGDIIVTANKRAESINRVPMSITAASGDLLIERGVNTIADLSKIVPSFHSSDTFVGTPFYTLRGIGFADSGLGSSPAVTVYSDQVPLPYPSMTRLAVFDVERVEVLKGPQGTLFGNNATGGAINYIPAGPTREFSAGVNASFGRFDTAIVEGYVSGPLTSTLGFRVAAKTTQSSDWQYNYTRNDSLGAKDQLAGRILLDWRPDDRLSAVLTISGWRDHSEAVAPQFAALDQLNLYGCNTATGQGCISAQVRTTVPAPRNNRAADWDAGFDPRHRDYFYQFSGRIDYRVGNGVTVTSITSYERYHNNMHLDNDGTHFKLLNGDFLGTIRSFYQEGRVAADIGDVKLIVGGNYQRDRTEDDYFVDLSESTTLNQVSPLLPINGFHAIGRYKIRTAAAFANLDYKIGNEFTLHGGIRYTDTKTNFRGCSADPGDNSLASAFNFGLIPFLTGHVGNIPPGGCETLDANFNPGIVPGMLHQHNVSWRAGADYTPSGTVLVYGTISKGYKAGGFSTISSSSYIQHQPVTQESVLAYEAGTKLTLLNKTLQFNTAVFYDDYKNKQFRGRIVDPLGLFGALEALVNIPKSRIFGVEMQATWRPVPIITFNGGVTYLNTKVTSDYSNYDPFGNLITLEGRRFPFTPKWNANADVEVKPPLTDRFDGYAGAAVSYQSRTRAAFVDPALLGTLVGDPLGAPDVTLSPRLYDIDPYALIDLRFGVQQNDGRWRFGGFVRNLTDKYYWNSVGHATDTSFRFTGTPRTYGVEASYKF